MNKKSLVTVLAAVFVVLGLIVVVAPAQAASSKKACTYQVRETAWYTGIKTYGGDEGASLTGQYRAKGRIMYDACTAGTTFHTYQVVIENTSGGCGGSHEFRVNPNVIGWYNLPEKVVNCFGDGSLILTWSQDVVVLKTAPSNVKCLGSVFEVEQPARPDPVHNLPSVCLTFV